MIPEIRQERSGFDGYAFQSDVLSVGVRFEAADIVAAGRLRHPVEKIPDVAPRRVEFFEDAPVEGVAPAEDGFFEGDRGKSADIPPEVPPEVGLGNDDPAVGVLSEQFDQFVHRPVELVDRRGAALPARFRPLPERPQFEYGHGFGVDGRCGLGQRMRLVRDEKTILEERRHAEREERVVVQDQQRSILRFPDEGVIETAAAGVPGVSVPAVGGARREIMAHEVGESVAPLFQRQDLIELVGIRDVEPLAQLFQLGAQRVILWHLGEIMTAGGAAEVVGASHQNDGVHAEFPRGVGDLLLQQFARGGDDGPDPEIPAVGIGAQRAEVHQRLADPGGCLEQQ